MPVDQLHSGDRLARDVVVGPSEIPLLRTGVRISQHYVEGLRRADVRAVYVDDALSDGIEPLEPISQKTREHATRSLRQAFGTMTRSDGGAVTGVPEDTLGILKELARMIVEDVAGCGEAAVAISDLATVDSYTLQHSIDVTAVGLLIAQRLWTSHGWIDGRGARRWDRTEQRLVLLGQALLLHDIGKLGLPQEVLQKPGPLTSEERELVFQHPDIGYTMLSGATMLSPLVKDVVRHHHERWDGSGYPSGTARTRISQFSRIAGVADVFDAVSSARPYKPAAPVHVAYEAIVDGDGKLFDSDVVGTFRQTVAPYPPGLSVELSDGRRGIVSECPAGVADRPTVRVIADAHGPLDQPAEVALTDDPGLSIVAVDTPLPRAGEGMAAA
ncbi:MAG TPA: HD-GYP domain-containing protein [Gaiellaceae bacterium]|nr:HD-GYP domain-containing protein [Gaiellaceae bacterium]